MKICIDAGHNHSGWDTGAFYGGFREQDITFYIAKKLSAILKKYGVEVIETRPIQTKNLGTNLTTSLSERSDLANNNKVDYFVSLHCNANADLSAKGTETYVLGLGGKAEQLARWVNNSLCKALGTVNRGVKAKNLAVLRNTTMPAILIEMAFLSNEKDRDLLVNRQEDAATGIAAGMVEFLGLKIMNQYSYDNTVNSLVEKGITTIENMSYWEKVLDGREPLNKDYVRAMFDRLLAKIPSSK